MLIIILSLIINYNNVTSFINTFFIELNNKITCFQGVFTTFGTTWLLNVPLC